MTVINKTKPISVMLFIDWFYPAYKAGGPIKSVNNIVMSLKDPLRFTIVTSNQDVDLTILDVPEDVMIKNNGFDIIYLSSNFQNAKKFKELYNEIKPDIIYYNTPFSFKYTLLPYAVFKNFPDLKHVIAPRGAFSESCLAQKSFKKKIFLLLANLFFYKKDIIWHATSDIEKQEIARNIKNQVITRIATTPSSPLDENVKAPTKEKGKLRLTFLSRIQGIKNLLYILEILTETNSLSSVKLDIYGPIEEDFYWSECLQLINKNSNITYKGELTPDEVKNVIGINHFMVLPTKNENFGHVITEFISRGIPVIISDRTPWLDLEKEGVGYALSLDAKEKWIQVLEHLIEIGDEQYQSMSENCKNYARKNIVDPQIIQDNLSLFTGSYN